MATKKKKQAAKKPVLEQKPAPAQSKCGGALTWKIIAGVLAVALITVSCALGHHRRQPQLRRYRMRLAKSRRSG